jgi:ribosomal protein S12 methylthiotransferase
LEAIVAEARELAGLGARELCIVAQDTGIYGRDLYGEPRTAALMRELCRVDGIEWIRLLYVHPLHLGDDIIEVLATEPKMCRYLDLPVQHASSSVLARMGRGYDNDFVRALVEKLRRQVEGIALRTSIIVGFPGETDADFDELMRSVRELRFDHLGAFEYSPERGTPAAAFEDGLSAHLVAQRHKELMLAQQRIAFEILDGRVGATETALVEYGGPEMESDYVARTRRESPEVDGRVYVTASAGIELGSLVPVRILQRSEYDLIAEPLGS